MNCAYALNNQLVVSSDDPKKFEVDQAFNQAKTSCPALKRSCPFGDPRNVLDAKKTMLSVPPSLNSEVGSSLSNLCNIILQHMYSVSINMSKKVQPFDKEMDFHFIISIIADKPNPLCIVKDMDKNIEKNISKKENLKKNTEKLNEKISLSKALKTGTARSHKAAENVQFVKNFIRKKIRRDLYEQFIIDLYFIYQALEEELNQFGPQYFPKLHRPDILTRIPSLEKDVSYFLGQEEWKTTLQPTPTVQDYINRIRSIARKDPLLLLAHSYTRYLGDLSGGRALASIAEKALHLNKKDGGLAFYDFSNIPSPKKFKDIYRNELDSLNLSPQRIHDLVQEANVAFVLNVRVFEELDVMGGEFKGASVTPLQDALAFTLKNQEEEEETKNKVCPFMVSRKEISDHSTKQCPFSLSKNKTSKSCPWPFIFVHDPLEGSRDFRTWIVIGLLFSLFV